MEQEGVNYITCALSVLDRLAEHNRMNPEDLSPDQALSLLDDLVSESDRIRTRLKYLDQAIMDSFNDTQIAMFYRNYEKLVLAKGKVYED